MVSKFSKGFKKTKGKGATLVEYSLLIALIAITSLGAVTATGVNIRDIFTGVGDTIEATQPGGDFGGAGTANTNFSAFTNVSNTSGEITVEFDVDVMTGAPYAVFCNDGTNTYSASVPDANTPANLTGVNAGTFTCGVSATAPDTGSFVNILFPVTVAQSWDYPNDFEVAGTWGTFGSQYASGYSEDGITWYSAEFPYLLATSGAGELRDNSSGSFPKEITVEYPSNPTEWETRFTSTTNTFRFYTDQTSLGAKGSTIGSGDHISIIATGPSIGQVRVNNVTQITLPGYNSGQEWTMTWARNGLDRDVTFSNGSSTYSFTYNTTSNNRFITIDIQAPGLQYFYVNT